MSGTDEVAARTPFHRGELAVQERAGTLALARQIGRIVQRELPPGVEALLAGQRLAVLAGRDAAGQIWASPLIGQPGFIQALDPSTLAIAADLAEGDPLATS